MSKRDKVIGIVSWSLFALLVAGSIFWFISKTQSEKVEASIFTYNVVNPSLLSIEYRVTNTTDKPGYSNCSITMNDKSYEYSGADYGYKSAKEISPGETYSGVASLKVSNGGANYITQGKITCTID